MGKVIFYNLKEKKENFDINNYDRFSVRFALYIYIVFNNLSKFGKHFV